MASSSSEGGNTVVIPETVVDLDNNAVEFVAIDTTGQNQQRQQQQQEHAVDTAEMRYTTIPMEVLEAAGIDIENSGELTEEQLNLIMSLVGSNGVVQQPDQKQHQQSTIQQPLYTNDMTNVSSSEVGDRLTLYVQEDGSVKLTDTALQREFLFTPRQLALQNIDVNKLTDENLQRIVQIAMESNDMAVRKRRRIEDADCAEVSGSSFATNTSMELSPATGSRKTLAAEEHHADPQLSLIGTEVEVKRDGKMYSATIKYCRQSGGYKVQFDDGHFEWVSEDEIRLPDDDTPKKCSDHESYSEATGITAPGSTGGGAVSKNVSSRRYGSQVAGVKGTSPNGAQKQEEPNFCCVVCDRKVYQKEPQYIVIRIPACDECAKQKMILLENTTKDSEAQTSYDEEENVEVAIGDQKEKN